MDPQIALALAEKGMTPWLNASHVNNPLEQLIAVIQLSGSAYIYYDEGLKWVKKPVHDALDFLGDVSEQLASIPGMTVYKYARAVATNDGLKYYHQPTFDEEQHFPDAGEWLDLEATLATIRKGHPDAPSDWGGFSCHGMVLYVTYTQEDTSPVND